MTRLQYPRDQSLYRQTQISCKEPCYPKSGEQSSQNIDLNERVIFRTSLEDRHTHTPFPFQINITKTSFPQRVQKIRLSNVEELQIEADAITHLASLKSIELLNVGTLTLLNRSLALGNESGPIFLTINDVKSLQMHPETFANWRNSDSWIMIQDVEMCRMYPLTMPNSTLLRILILAHVTSLTIDNDAFGANSVIEDVWVTEVASLFVLTGAIAPNTTIHQMQFVDVDDLDFHSGAFAPNTTIHQMQFVDVDHLDFHSGAFSRNSFIHRADVDHVPYLTIGSGGIEADIDELNIRHVTMATCENNTFGSTIQSMTLVSSHINRTKTGCISASTGWKDLSVKKSKFDNIQQDAIQGTIGEVKIEESKIGTIETRGFSLNVKRFSVQNSAMGEVSEDALMVSADDGITLCECEIDILRKHAFMNLNPGATDQIRIQSLTVKQPENESMSFNDRTKVNVSGLTLGIPCKCDVETLAMSLGLASRLTEGDPEQSQWFSQTRCESHDTTRPSLAEFHRENCPDPTTTTFPTTTTTTTTTTGSSSNGVMGQDDGGPPPVTKAGPREPPRSLDIDTGGTNTWLLLGLLIPISLIMLIVIAAVLVRRRRRMGRNSDQAGSIRPTSTERPASCSSRRALLTERDTQAAEQNAPYIHPPAQNAADTQATAQSGPDQTAATNAPDTQAAATNAPDIRQSPHHVPSSPTEPAESWWESETGADGARPGEIRPDWEQFRPFHQPPLVAGHQASRRQPRVPEWSPKDQYYMSAYMRPQLECEGPDERPLIPGFPMNKKKNPAARDYLYTHAPESHAAAQQGPDQAAATHAPDIRQSPPHVPSSPTGVAERETEL